MRLSDIALRLANHHDSGFSHGDYRFKRASESRWIILCENGGFEREDNRDGVFFNLEDLIAKDYIIEEIK